MTLKTIATQDLATHAADSWWNTDFQREQFFRVP